MQNDVEKVISEGVKTADEVIQRIGEAGDAQERKRVRYMGVIGNGRQVIGDKVIVQRVGVDYGGEGDE